jgi:type IV secretion system protein VirB8
MAQTNEEGLATYYQDGMRWEAEIVRKAKRSRALAWFVAMIFGAMTMLSLVVLMMLVPLKSFEPYIVTVDQTTGHIEVKTGLTRPANLTEQEAITQANVVRYIRSREGYDPYRIEENFEIAALLSTGTAANELQRLYSATNTQNPARIYGEDTRVLVEIKSVTFPNESTSLVRFSTQEVSATDSTTRHWISVVRFQYTDTPATNEWRFENPLGFQVVDYRRDQETVTPGGS